MEAHGHNGQVRFDGQFVTITRQGFLARASVGKGEKHIPITSIAAVQWKPAGPLVNGYIQFTAGGQESRAAFGRQTTDAARDENSVVFTRKQMPQFEQLRAAVQHALAARVQGTPPPPAQPPMQQQASPQERMAQLQGLHQARMISDAEFEQRRQEILRSI